MLLRNERYTKSQQQTDYYLVCFWYIQITYFLFYRILYHISYTTFSKNISLIDIITT